MLLHLLLETHYITSTAVWLDGEIDRKRRSILCCVWTITPLMPNIKSKFYLIFETEPKIGLAVLVLLAPVNKEAARFELGDIPETPTKTLTLEGA